jgi:hypothetical protein
MQWCTTEFLEHLKHIEARLVVNGEGDGFFIGDSAIWAD